MKHSIFAICLISIFYMFGLTTLEAQPYPNRPIQIIVPLGPGSAVDIQSRLFAEELEKILKTPIVIINKPGASMALATDFVINAKKDGYTILYGVATTITAKCVQPETIPFDPFKVLEPLGLHTFNPLAIGVLEEAPWKTFAEFVDYAKKHPEEIRITATGINAHANLNMHIVEGLTGAQFTVLPCEGIQTITLVLGRHAEATSFSLSSLLPHVHSKKIRILLTSMKLSNYPDWPTIDELGYRGKLTTPWFALFAPSGVPEEVKNVLVPAIKEAINNPELVAKINRIGGVIVDYKSPAELRQIMLEDCEKMAAVAIKIGLRK
jgi:tripartite-type tricarboxylate transporter receptor subunit TctC